MASQLATPSADSLNPPPTELGDLGLDMLNAIFLKLGPSPMYLAAASCVCKAWHTLIMEKTLRFVCMGLAPVLYEAMGFSAIDASPGGWFSLYKLLTYCGGVPLSPGYDPHEPGKSLPRWWGFLGHVQNRLSGFQTGLDLKIDFTVAGDALQDTVFVSRFCTHSAGADSPWQQLLCASRGLVKNFPESSVARQSGALAYLEGPLEARERIQRLASLCIYCWAPLFQLPRLVTGNWDTHLRASTEAYTTVAHVCANGHLRILGTHVRCCWAPPALRPMECSKEGHQLETYRLSRVLAIAFVPMKSRSGFELIRNYDAFTVAKQIEHLAHEVGADA